MKYSCWIINVLLYFCLLHGKAFLTWMFGPSRACQDQGLWMFGGKQKEKPPSKKAFAFDHLINSFIQNSPPWHLTLIHLCISVLVLPGI